MKKRILVIFCLLISINEVIISQEYVESKTSIPSNNVNNAIGEKNAIWRNSSMAPGVQDNFPNQQNWWSIFQTQFHDTRYDAQLAFGLNKQDLWLRYNYNGNWKQWKEILTSSSSGYVKEKKSIPSNDLNNAKGETNAIWRNSSMAPGVQDNFPNQQNWWSVFQTQFHDTRYDAQLAFGLNKEDLWLRYNYNGNWKQWKKLILTDYNGNVAIGTSSTGNHKLAVEGSIGAREVKVEASGWSDFVFYEDYQLPTLNEVENHIKEKGHLKDIPSAEKVKQEGFFLGEMNAKLLQKIEELTLYTIQQQKELEQEKKKNTNLEARLTKLEELFLKD
jgi:hypothetical protein